MVSLNTCKCWMALAFSCTATSWLFPLYDSWDTSYTNPVARICVNSHITNICRGTRQGFPLSLMQMASCHSYPLLLHNWRSSHWYDREVHFCLGIRYFGLLSLSHNSLYFWQQEITTFADPHVVTLFSFLGLKDQLPLYILYNNACPLLSQLKLQTRQWMDLPLDSIGWVIFLKTVCSGQFPFKIPKSFFKCHPPRMVLAFPNFYLYYLASQ